MAKEKVSFDKVQKLQKQQVKPNEQVDTIDAVDKSFGRIFSKIGKFFVENW